MIKTLYTVKNHHLKLLTSAMIFGLFSTSAFSEKLPPVKVELIEPWHNGLVDVLNCKISTPYLIQLASENDAKLTFILPAGSQVKKNTLVAQQDDYYLNKNIDRLTYQLASAKLVAEHNDKEYQRLLALPNNLVSSSELNAFSLTREQAILEQKELQNRIEEQQHRIKKLKYFSPADGEIAMLNAEPGQLVRKGSSLLTFLADKNREIKCELPLKRYSSHNKINQNAFKLTTGEAITLKRTSKIIDPDNQVLSIYLTLPDTSSPFLLEQRIKVVMQTKTKGLTRLPVDSLNLHKDGNFVWQVTDTTEVKKHLVKIVANQAKYFLVRSKLNPGDKVVTLGKNGLQENKKVSFSELTNKGTN